MRTYKGIELENTDKIVKMAHSRFLEKDEGIDYFAELLGREKASLTNEQFEAVSALNSVANMNYQICNGGLDQYFFNQYDKEREPFNPDDVKQVGKEKQVEMLRELQTFGKKVYPEKELENERLDRIISDFDGSYYEEEREEWYDDEEYEEGGYYEEEGGLNAPYDFDDRYYKVNNYLETLIEGYAQYLNKKIDQEVKLEKPLDELKKEAKEKAAEKNLNRTDGKAGKTNELEW